MKKEIKKLIEILREKDCVSVYPRKVTVPGCSVYVTEDNEPGEVEDVNAFRDYVLNNNTLEFELAATRKNPDKTSTSIDIKQEGIGIICDNSKTGELYLNDDECKSCKFYSGKNKCIVREYETKER